MWLTEGKTHAQDANRGLLEGHAVARARRSLFSVRRAAARGRGRRAYGPTAFFLRQQQHLRGGRGGGGGERGVAGGGWRERGRDEGEGEHV